LQNSAVFLANLAIFSKFGDFCRFWQIEAFLVNFGKFRHFLQFSTILTNFTIFGKFGNFWQILRILLIWLNSQANLAVLQNLHFLPILAN